MLQDSLGGSGGYETFGAQMLRFVPTNEHLAKKREGGLGTHWQMIYMLFAMGGSAVSAALSGSLPSSAKGVGLPAAFVGGAIMLFGPLGQNAPRGVIQAWIESIAHVECGHQFQDPLSLPLAYFHMFHLGATLLGTNRNKNVFHGFLQRMHA